MSLIRARRERKKDWADVRRGRPTRDLIIFLLLVVAAIWYLTTSF